MNSPYFPWEAQSQYPGSESMTLEDLARQRMGGNVRQRQGSFAEFLNRLRMLMGGQPPPMPTPEPTMPQSFMQRFTQ